MDKKICKCDWCKSDDIELIGQDHWFPIVRCKQCSHEFYFFPKKERLKSDNGNNNTIPT